MQKESDSVDICLYRKRKRETLRKRTLRRLRGFPLGILQVAEKKRNYEPLRKAVGSAGLLRFRRT